ncbi:MAG: hypothetical protein HOE90_04395 [Bacteriovoracaceae bacterium]|jgi:hypothetical protein|nr:hypothetical protein [Bacteriovoracaceae bacterium]
MKNLKLCLIASLILPTLAEAKYDLTDKPEILSCDFNKSDGFGRKLIVVKDKHRYVPVKFNNKGEYHRLEKSHREAKLTRLGNYINNEESFHLNYKKIYCCSPGGFNKIVININKLTGNGTMFYRFEHGLNGILGDQDGFNRQGKVIDTLTGCTFK